MPRFYFDVNDVATAAPDDAGLELPDLLAAEQEAKHALGEIARDALRGSNAPPILSIGIRNGQGEHLLSVSLTYRVASGERASRA